MQTTHIRQLSRILMVLGLLLLGLQVVAPAQLRAQEQPKTLPEMLGLVNQPSMQAAEVIPADAKLAQSNLCEPGMMRNEWAKVFDDTHAFTGLGSSQYSARLLRPTIENGNVIVAIRFTSIYPYIADPYTLVLTGVPGQNLEGCKISGGWQILADDGSVLYEGTGYFELAFWSLPNDSDGTQIRVPNFKGFWTWPGENMSATGMWSILPVEWQNYPFCDSWINNAAQYDWNAEINGLRWQVQYDRIGGARTSLGWMEVTTQTATLNFDGITISADRSGCGFLGKTKDNRPAWLGFDKNSGLITGNYQVANQPEAPFRTFYVVRQPAPVPDICAAVTTEAFQPFAKRAVEIKGLESSGWQLFSVDAGYYDTRIVLIDSLGGSLELVGLKGYSGNTCTFQGRFKFSGANQWGGTASLTFDTVKGEFSGELVYHGGLKRALRAYIPVMSHALYLPDVRLQAAVTDIGTPPVETEVVDTDGNR